MFAALGTLFKECRSSGNRRVLPSRRKDLDCLRQCLKDTVSSYKTAGGEKKKKIHSSISN